MFDTDTRQCVLLTPMSEEFLPLRRVMANALRESGIEPILFDENVIANSPLIGTTFRAIERADLIIADVTGDNPNVMYEAGFAHAMGRPVLFIVQQGVGRLPSDVAGNFFLVYDPSKPNDLHHKIQFWANRYLGEWKSARTYKKPIKSPEVGMPYKPYNM
ncbi:nucleotide-binding protein [candidate division KSB1 bacterium]|nr:nucleotide-binding protein [candidate division KSB1 bacterium]